MYQYPAGSDGEAPQRPNPPQRLIRASRFMYVGAAISTIVFMIDMATIGILKSIYHNSITSSQLNVDIGENAIADLLVIGLWVLMAWANRRGRSWARIVATVLFGLYTLRFILWVRLLPQGLNVNLVVEILTWLGGLGAIILIWNRESSAYYQAVSTTPT
jgi:hypothetical protein